MTEQRDVHLRADALIAMLLQMPDQYCPLADIGTMTGVDGDWTVTLGYLVSRGQIFVYEGFVGITIRERARRGLKAVEWMEM